MSNEPCRSNFNLNKTLDEFLNKNTQTDPNPPTGALKSD